MTNRITDAIECFNQMNSELTRETNTHGEQAKWAVGECLSSHACSVYVIDFPTDFKQRCVEKLEQLGDIAAEAQQHDEAINHYSAALSLNPVILHDVFMKRSKVYMAKRSWEEALDDTNQVHHFCLA
jgi:tetratricopeptide (TPR) repeat protein